MRKCKKDTFERLRENATEGDIGVVARLRNLLSTERKKENELLHIAANQIRDGKG